MIPFSKHSVPNEVKKIFEEILKTGWFTHGKYTNLFEKEFKKFTKAKYCTVVSSCTAGLHLSLLALDLKKNSEILVPAMSHTATAHAAEYAGLKVKFLDVNRTTGNIEYENIKKNISKKTKAVMVVHMNGNSCEMKKIKAICDKKKISLIEDCAHGLGTFYQGRHVGNFGVAGSFSFYPTKQITTGEGGVVITNNKKIFKKIKKLKAFGIDKDIKDRKLPGKYDVKMLGFNYRMTELHAAMGLLQLKKYKSFLKKRKELAKRYILNFKNFSHLRHAIYNKESSFFIFPILTKSRDRLLKHLIKKKIGVSIHYAKSLPFMSYYKKKYKTSNNKFKNSINYADSNISLPVYPKLTIRNVDKISLEIKKFLSGVR